MKRILLILLVFIPFTYAGASEQSEIISSANNDFKEGKYAKAAEAYEKVIASGVGSVEVYYNLGNSYFKLNKLPEAILNYEKAKKINPGDEDIVFNIKVANSKIVDKIEVLPELFYIRYWKAVKNVFSVDQWAKLVLVLFSLFFVMSGLYLYSRRQNFRIISFWLAIFLLISTGFAMTIAIKNYQLLVNQKEAIIFSAAITVKSSPSESSVDLFVLHEGTKVVISDNLGTWLKITISNGSVGWIPASELRPI